MFLKNISRELRRQMEHGSINGFNHQGKLSHIWESVNAIIAEEDDGDEISTRCCCKWKDLNHSPEKLHRIESLLLDMQSEALILRRQNYNLVQDKHQNERKLVEAMQKVKKLSLDREILERDLKVSKFREMRACAFIKCLRKLWLGLQKDEGEIVTIAEMKSMICEDVDLNGLVEIDQLLLEEEFISPAELATMEDKKKSNSIFESTFTPPAFLPLGSSVS